MRARLTRIRTPFAPLVALSLAAGCAVITVDVDVYKGPLTNDEDVQIQQMFTMASAAKPLLIELRDRLEWGARIDACREHAIDDRWYVDGYVPDPRLSANAHSAGPPEPDAERSTPSKQRYFVDLRARRVNAILSLYEDVEDSHYSRLAERYVQLVRDFELQRSAHTRVEPRDHDVVEASRPEFEQQARWFFTPEPGKFRSPRSLLQVSEGKSGLGAHLRGAVERNAEDQSLTAFLRVAVEGPRVSTNELFSLLSQDEPARQVAEALIEKGGKRADRVREAKGRIQEIAASYLASRRVLSDLLEVSLELVVLQSRLGADLEARRELARVVTALVQPQYLAWVASSPELEDPERDGVVATILAAYPTRLVDGSVFYWSATDYRDARAGLARELLADPEHVVDALVAAHRATPRPLTAARRSTPVQTHRDRRWREYYGDEYRRAYGISTEPGFAPKRWNPDRLAAVPRWMKGLARPLLGELDRSSEQLLVNFQPRAAMGLEGGRLPVGLERLVSEYLSRTHRNGQDEVLESQLVDALTRFAQKVLFIANNEGLLNPPPPPALVPGAIYVVWHHLLGGTAIERWITENFPGMSRSGVAVPEAQRNYISVLQAVGNSILVQADEYRKQKRFEAGEEGRAKLEADVVRRTLATTEGEFVGQVLEQLGAESATLREKRDAADEALEKAKAALQKLSGQRPEAKRELEEAKRVVELLAPAVAGTDSVLERARREKARETELAGLWSEAKAALGEFRAAVQELHAAGSAANTAELKRNAYVSQREKVEARRARLADLLEPLAERLGESRVELDVEKGIRAALRKFDAKLSELGDPAGTARDARQHAASFARPGEDDLDAWVAAFGQTVTLAIRVAAVRTAIEGGELKAVLAAPAGGADLTAAVRKAARDWVDGTAGASKALAGCTLDLSDAAAAWSRLIERGETLAGDRGAATTARNEREEALADLDEKIGEAEAESAKREREAQDATCAYDHLTLTIARVGVRHEVLMEDARTGKLSEVPPRGAYYALVAWLGEQVEGSSGAGKSDWETALEEVSSRRFAIPTLDEGALACAGSPADVLDHLIGALQHEYIQTLLTTGEDSLATRRLRAAHAAAVARRANLMRIRPASAFLRTSYPATTLQDDPALGWSNRLSQQGLRSIPFVDSVGSFLIPEQFPEGAIQAGIDKQFWQNVNRVRVSGTGNSNYVIAKDDIGNWYVKSYEANPEAVLRSARNLGAFAMGQDMGTDLLSRIERREAEAAGEEAPETALERSTLGRLARRYEHDYRQAVADEKEDVREALADDAHADRITAAFEALTDVEAERDAWGADIEAASEPHLSDALTKVSTTVDLEDDDDANDVALPDLVDALRGVIRFHRDLDEALGDRVDDAVKADAAAKEKAEETGTAAEIAAAKLTEATEKHEAAKAALAERKAVAEAKPDDEAAQAELDKAQAAADAAATALDAAKDAAEEAKTAAAEAKSAAGDASAAKLRVEAARKKAAELGRELVEDSLAELRKADERYQGALDFLNAGIQGDPAED